MIEEPTMITESRRAETKQMKAFELSDTARAIRHLGERKARGKIVITVAKGMGPSRSDSRDSSWKEGWR
jgi:hypothetical protein